MTTARLTQTAIEGVIEGSPAVQVTQAALEAVIANTAASTVEFAQCAIEIVVPNQPPSPAVTDVLSTVFPLTNYQVPGGIRGLGWPVMKSPEESTTFTEGKNFYAVTVQNAVNPKWHWTLIYNYLKDNPKDVPSLYAPNTDYETMQGFFLEVGARNQTFLFSDPSDNYVGPGVIANPPWRVNWTPIVGAIIVVSGNAWQAVTVAGPTGWTVPAFSGSSQTDGGVSWSKLGAAGSVEPNPSAQLQFFGDGAYWYAPIQRNFGGRFLEDVTDLNTSTATGGSTFTVYLNGVAMQSGGYLILGPGLKLSSQIFYGLYVRFNPWASFTNFSTGDLFIDPNGHIQQAVNGGQAGPLSPNWNDSGGNTRDGSVFWVDLGLLTVVTAQFNFFFRVRFETDDIDFEEFLNEVWTAGGPDTKNGRGYLQIQTARPKSLPTPACDLYPAHHF